MQFLILITAPMEACRHFGYKNVDKPGVRDRVAKVVSLVMQVNRRAAT